MRSNNFVSFFTVQGFFLGIVFAVLKSESAEDLLIYVLLVTIFFYLFAHLSIAFYLKTVNIKSQYFPKDSHERDLDYYVREINKREKMIDGNYDTLGTNTFMDNATYRKSS